MLHSLQRHRELAIDLSPSINPNEDSHEKKCLKTEKYEGNTGRHRFKFIFTEENSRHSSLAFFKWSLTNETIQIFVILPYHFC